MSPFLLVVSIVFIGSAFSAQAAMYKWVDENGNIHFSDSIPLKYISRAHKELNHQGIVIRHKEAAKTPEQKAEDKRLANERKRLALLEKKKRQRDRVLLDTYTTERDLIVARDARLDAVDAQIRLAETIIGDAKKNLESLNKQVAMIQQSNRQVPVGVYQRIDKEKRQVSVQTKVKKRHQRRYDEISAQFNGYIKRFKVLKSEQKASRERLTLEREQGW